MATRPVLRIFISSTSTDLTSYRKKVRDAVLELEGLPIAMETFSAGDVPARECMRMAAEADAVVSEGGILLADTCGFGKFSIELRIALAEALLLAGEPQKALKAARWALDRSEQPDCQYAWGKADGLHFCGLAHLQLGEHELARQRLTAALELRTKIRHGRVEETRRALERL